MSCNQRDFRKDKPMAVKLRRVCEFTPLETKMRDNSVQNNQISNGVKILTIPCWSLSRT